VQHPQGRIVLRVVAGPAWTEGTRGRLAGEVREVLGFDATIDVVASIPRLGRAKHRDFVRAEDAGEAPAAGGAA